MAGPKARGPLDTSAISQQPLFEQEAISPAKKKKQEKRRRKKLADFFRTAFILFSGKN